MENLFQQQQSQALSPWCTIQHLRRRYPQQIPKLKLHSNPKAIKSTQSIKQNKKVTIPIKIKTTQTQTFASKCVKMSTRVSSCKNTPNNIFYLNRVQVSTNLHNFNQKVSGLNQNNPSNNLGRFQSAKQSLSRFFSIKKAFEENQQVQLRKPKTPALCQRLHKLMQTKQQRQQSFMSRILNTQHYTISSRFAQKGKILKKYEQRQISHDEKSDKSQFVKKYSHKTIFRFKTPSGNNQYKNIVRKKTQKKHPLDRLFSKLQ